MIEEDLNRGEEIESGSIDPQELGLQSHLAIERIREQFASLRSPSLGRTDELGRAEPDGLPEQG